jgi:hypothetical protein
MPRHKHNTEADLIWSAVCRLEELTTTSEAVGKANVEQLRKELLATRTTLRVNNGLLRQVIQGLALEGAGLRKGNKI